MKLISHIIPLLLAAITPLAATIETRAAFDVGSGMTKVTVAHVDIEAHTIVEVLYSDAAVVPLKYLDSEGNIPDTTASELYDVMDRYITKAHSLGATSFAAVGTEALRKANNGAKVLGTIRDNLGLYVRLLPQEDEALIGYLSAVACDTQDDSLSNPMVVLDIGWGSTQLATMTADGLTTDGFEVGFTVVEGIWQLLHGQGTSVFPFNRDLIEDMVDHLDGLLHSNYFNGTHTVRYSLSTVATAGKILGKPPSEPLTKANIVDALEILGGLNPEQRDLLLSKYSDQSFPVYALVTLLAVMEYNEIGYVQYYEGPVGNTAGMLIFDDLWG